ncbi:hypothetical protein E5S69_31455 [Cupriavidus necator]|uniref:hypothetical protein n=1 Tax=Cupriavidus necator TaxID=106590 RepID=UPI0014900730|nr:hypothetical protein [Cupriavidus necator]NOV28004.1 hypothetical protein [Cupriavidus necator]
MAKYPMNLLPFWKGDKGDKGDVDTQFRADVANATDPAKGAALVGLNPALTYPTGTIGARLALLLSWAQVQNFQLVSATRDANGAITTASIKWPDGTSGVFTTDVASTAFPGAIDAWHATYAGTPAKTVTQPAVTRDSNGAVTVQPAITIS